MPHVNVLKQIRVGKGWKLVPIPHNHPRGYDWRALPEGRYVIGYWERGKRKPNKTEMAQNGVERFSIQKRQSRWAQTSDHKTPASPTW